jgi:hypothetical protein
MRDMMLEQIRNRANRGFFSESMKPEKKKRAEAGRADDDVEASRGTSHGTSHGRDNRGAQAFNTRRRGSQDVGVDERRSNNPTVPHRSDTAHLDRVAGFGSISGLKLGVCVCVRARARLRLRLRVYVACVCVRVRVRVCACASVCEHTCTHSAAENP